MEVMLVSDEAVVAVLGAYIDLDSDKRNVFLRLLVETMEEEHFNLLAEFMKIRVKVKQEAIDIEHSYCNAVNVEEDVVSVNPANFLDGEFEHKDDLDLKEVNYQGNSSVCCPENNTKYSYHEQMSYI